MKNKKIIILTIIIIILIIILTGIYLYTNNKEYTYICLNQELTENQCIIEDYLEECTTNKKIPSGVVTNESEILPYDNEGLYCLTKDKYEVGEMLYKKDFESTQYEKVTSSDIALLNEVEVLDHGSNSEDLTRYKAYIKDDKLYATNLSTNEEKLIFDTENVKNIAIRPYCCAGNAKLLILTTKGNLYISKQDCTYSFNFNISFEKSEVNDIVSLKLIPEEDYDIVKSLYGINSKGEEILITEPVW